MHMHRTNIRPPLTHAHAATPPRAENALTIPPPEGARAGESFQRYMTRAPRGEVTAFFLGVAELLGARGIGQFLHHR